MLPASVKWEGRSALYFASSSNHSSLSVCMCVDISRLYRQCRGNLITKLLRQRRTVVLSLFTKEALTCAGPWWWSLVCTSWRWSAPVSFCLEASSPNQSRSQYRRMLWAMRRGWSSSEKQIVSLTVERVKQRLFHLNIFFKTGKHTIMFSCLYIVLCYIS